jgi:hypothetical protein
VDSPGSGKASMAGCCECGDEPSGSGATESVGSFIPLCGYETWSQDERFWGRHGRARVLRILQPTAD